MAYIPSATFPNGWLNFELSVLRRLKFSSIALPFTGEPNLGAQLKRWKVRVGPNGVPVIGDMINDPGELRDFAAQRPVETRLLTDHLGMLLAMRKQWQKRTWGVVTAVTADGAAALDEATTP